MSGTVYAIGKPGAAARIFVRNVSEATAQAQCGAGEIAVVVPNETPRSLTAGGTVGAVRTAVALSPITTAVQLATAIPAPAGSTWTAKGQSFTGPQSVTFGTADSYPLAFTGAWSGATVVTVLSATDFSGWLIERVKVEAERRRMLVMSSGGSKKTVYAAKAAEIENWYALGGIGAVTSTLLAAFNLMNSGVRARKFRFSIQDAAKHGDTVPAAIARFVAGADASQNETARVEGIEQASVDAIKAVSSSAAKLTAYNAINWSA